MKHVIFKIIKFLIVFIIYSLLFINIFFNQSISPLYFQLIKEDRNAIISFLQKIKNLPSFQSFLEMNKIIYGEQIEQEVFASDQKRKENITKLEFLLEKNPKSRDLLYNLYLLYNEDGQTVTAEGYLKRAKEIDPTIEKQILNSNF